jgi:hypothetical protein
VIGQLLGPQHLRLRGPAGGRSATNLFFAGDPIARHIAEAGVEGFWRLLAEPWQRFSAWGESWLKVDHARGATEIAGAYRALLDGALDPSVGLVVAPSPTG